MYESLWSSDSVPERSNDYYYTRYYLELTNNGELVVRALHAGESESVCVWSTSSCNEYLKTIKDLQTTTTSIMTNIFKSFRFVTYSLTHPRVWLYLFNYILSRNIINEIWTVGVIAAIMRHLSDLKEVLEQMAHVTARGISSLFDQLIHI